MFCRLCMLKLSRAGDGDCPFTQVWLSGERHPCRFYSALQGRTSWLAVLGGGEVGISWVGKWKQLRSCHGDGPQGCSP